MNDQPNPAWKNAPYEVTGWIEGIPFLASASSPEEPEPGVLWIKLPEREPYHFKGGKWVPWLNPPVGWENFLPERFNP